MMKKHEEKFEAELKEKFPDLDVKVFTNREEFDRWDYTSELPFLLQTLVDLYGSLGIIRKLSVPPYCFSPTPYLNKVKRFTTELIPCIKELIAATEDELKKYEKEKDDT